MVVLHGNTHVEVGREQAMGRRCGAGQGKVRGPYLLSCASRWQSRGLCVPQHRGDPRPPYHGTCTSRKNEVTSHEPAAAGQNSKPWGSLSKREANCQMITRNEGRNQSQKEKKHSTFYLN